MGPQGNPPATKGSLNQFRGLNSYLKSFLEKNVSFGLISVYVVGNNKQIYTLNKYTSSPNLNKRMIYNKEPISINDIITFNIKNQSTTENQSTINGTITEFQNLSSNNEFSNNYSCIVKLDNDKEHTLTPYELYTVYNISYNEKNPPAVWGPQTPRPQTPHLNAIGGKRKTTRKTSKNKKSRKVKSKKTRKIRK